MTATTFIGRWSHIVEKWNRRRLRNRNSYIGVLLTYITSTFQDAVTHPVRVRNQFLKNEKVILAGIDKKACDARGIEYKRLRLIREAIKDARILVVLNAAERRT